jgi:basic membrane protein A and related proteins
MMRIVSMGVIGFFLFAGIPGLVHAGIGKVCLVTTGNLQDHGFNQLAWEGMLSAKGDGLVREIVYREPDTKQNIGAEQNLTDFVQQGNCDLIVISGFELGNATVEAARSHPDQKMAIVDFDTSSAGDLPNLLGIVFQSDEAAFLAGYVAASVSGSGVIGTFGGQKMPPVVLFMEGLELGIQYFNKRHSQHINLKGWSTEKQMGLFTRDFQSIPAGYRMASRLYRGGADVVFPVAGLSSYGAVYSAVTSSKRFRLVIGVDVDFYQVLINTPGAKDVLLTSVLKRVDVAVKGAIARADRGEFKGGLYVGTLENGGVGIAPFYGLAERVEGSNPNIETELEEITQAIINGCLPTRRSGNALNPDCE